MTTLNSRTYFPITNKLCRGWLFKYIDRINYGIWDTEKDGPRFMYKKETILYSPRQCRRITMRDIERHLTSTRVEDTLYYTTWAGADTALLCIDIDNHEGHRNALNVAVWIRDCFFPQGYYEPSTHGGGIHFYLLVAIKNNGYPMKRALFNKYVADFEENLKYVVTDEFSTDSASVCGVHGIVTHKDANMNLVRDKLIKIPRPRTLEDALRLRNMPVYTLSDLKNVVDEAIKRQEENEAVKAKGFWNKINAKNVQPKKGIKSMQVESGSGHEKMYDSNPNRRIFNATCTSYRILQREPSVEEVHEYYCQWGLNTGEDVQNRRIKRIQDAIRKCGRRFNPSTSSGRRYEIRNYQQGRSLEYLKSKLTEQDLRGTNYRYRIRFEELDFFADVIADAVINDNIGNADRFGSVSSEFIKRAFEEAKIKGILRSKADDSKIVALRGLAIKSGMITVIDSSWVHGGLRFTEGGEKIIPAKGETQNRGMKYEITVDHPRYVEFQATKQKHKELLRERLAG